MVNPYTIQTGLHEQLYLAQTVTCQVDVVRGNSARHRPARHRPKLKRFDEADHFFVTLHRNDLEEQECFFNRLNSKVNFKYWQKVEWYKTFGNAKRLMYTFDHLAPNQENSFRNAVYGLESDLLDSMNTYVSRPEYSLVIYTQ